MTPAGAPLTPDDDQARSWLSDELARPEYSEELSPLTRAIRRVLQYLADVLSGSGDWRPPLEVVVLALLAIALVVIVVIVVRNPIRARRRAAGAVFDAETTGIVEALGALDSAREGARWDEAFVWSYRVLVLRLADAGLVHDGPGLTAHEASAHAGARLPGLAAPLTREADAFDAIRYGDAGASPADVDRLSRLSDEVMTALGARS
ncbi:DUF4129 domain-containing protein [Actinomyces sp. B33]|uniref:DUF4129 domain-containing protein n=1 Tax=Actinomyces sp. B33 TaxID=2942131 RepID=UPI00233FE63D|nr:DUF4129 domain-containing protein [Actinomyces sp. B33]MDC4232671.1 DUF4129 domain-containing protein [Actinomyces sp. B33]